MNSTHGIGNMSGTRLHRWPSTPHSLWNAHTDVHSLTPTTSLTWMVSAASGATCTDTTTHASTRPFATNWTRSRTSLRSALQTPRPFAWRVDSWNDHQRNCSMCSSPVTGQQPSKSRSKLLFNTGSNGPTQNLKRHAISHSSKPTTAILWAALA